MWTVLFWLIFVVNNFKNHKGLCLLKTVLLIVLMSQLFFKETHLKNCNKIYQLVTKILIWIYTCFRNPYTAYYKALMANALTSALRLRQRQPSIAFTREFLTCILMEDSCHYLFYSLIFLYVSPVTCILCKLRYESI